MTMSMWMTKHNTCIFYEQYEETLDCSNWEFIDVTYELIHISIDRQRSWEVLTQGNGLKS